MQQRSFLSAVHSLRKMLAEVDEVSVKKQASFGIIHVIFDNMDVHIKTLHQLTLPLLMFEVHPTNNYSREDSLSLEETLNLFNFDILDLDNERNAEEKEHFFMVVNTILANTICKEIKGLEWTKEHFPLHYEHKYMVAASTRTMLHVEPPRALDEKKTKDMIVLLEGFIKDI